jgi:hypothetical protein
MPYSVLSVCHEGAASLDQLGWRTYTMALPSNRKRFAMSLPDPQSITVNAVATSLPRVSVGPNQSVYQAADGSYKMTVSHQYQGKRIRSLVRFDSTKYEDSPTLTGVTVPSDMSVQLVINRPTVGFFGTADEDFVKGVLANLSASGYAIVPKLMGGEN